LAPFQFDFASYKTGDNVLPIAGFTFAIFLDQGISLSASYDEIATAFACLMHFGLDAFLVHDIDQRIGNRWTDESSTIRPSCKW